MKKNTHTQLLLDYHIRNTLMDLCIQKNHWALASGLSYPKYLRISKSTSHHSYFVLLDYNIRETSEFQHSHKTYITKFTFGYTYPKFNRFTKNLHSSLMSTTILARQPPLFFSNDSSSSRVIVAIHKYEDSSDGYEMCSINSKRSFKSVRVNKRFLMIRSRLICYRENQPSLYCVCFSNKTRKIKKNC